MDAAFYYTSNKRWKQIIFLKTDHENNILVKKLFIVLALIKFLNKVSFWTTLTVKKNPTNPNLQYCKKSKRV